MSFFSALYMLQYVLIVKIFRVTCILIQKKKKKKKKNDPYFGMGKNTKVISQNAPLSIFFLGKRRESLCLKPYEKLSLQVHFLTFSPACTKLDKASMMHLKIAQNVYFFTRISHLSNNRRGQNLPHIFQFKTPARKLTCEVKFECFCITKGTNFRNTKIIRHSRPENPQNPTQKDRNFEKMHSLTSAKMPTNKESIHFSRISHNDSICTH